MIGNTARMPNNANEVIKQSSVRKKLYPVEKYEKWIQFINQEWKMSSFEALVKFPNKRILMVVEKELEYGDAYGHIICAENTMEDIDEFIDAFPKYRDEILRFM